jgi:hypothetical protein
VLTILPQLAQGGGGLHWERACQQHEDEQCQHFPPGLTVLSLCFWSVLWSLASGPN